MYRIMNREKDDIPGFRESYTHCIGTYDTEEEAKANLPENTSYPHEGYGAGSGSIDNTYWIEKIEE